MDGFNETEHTIMLLNRAFEGLGINRETWLRTAMYGGGEVNGDIEASMVDAKRRLNHTMDWGRVVPDGFVTKFLVVCLGRDLLRSSSIRGLLADYQWTSGDNTEGLIKALGIDESRPVTEEVHSAAVEMNWIPSSRSAIDFTASVGLPMSYAIAGVSDDRPAMEVIEPIRPLPELLPFQKRVLESIVGTLEGRGRVITIMPTGSGKTRTSVEAILEHFRRTESPVNGVIWIADREELCEQAFQTFKQVIQHRSLESVCLWRYWMGNNIEVSAREGRLAIPGIVVTSVQQLQSRLRSSEIAASVLMDSCQVMIIDEVHRNLDWNEVLFREFDSRDYPPGVIGLTATPFRRESHESARLAKAFGSSVIAPVEGGERDPDMVAKDLTEQRILAKRVDLKEDDIGFMISYRGSEIDRLNDGLKVISSLMERGACSLLVFSESVAQSKSISAALRLNGIEARHLDSNTSTMDRRSIIEAFRTGRISVLSNYNILTTGFDAPNTDAVAIFRLTEDFDQPVIQQMIGRGLRGPKFGGTESCLFFIRGEYA